MVLGFLGTGAISEAMVRGLCGNAGYSNPILVSGRSQARSERLSSDYHQVEVITENALLVEKSDWVIVAVLPDQVEATLGELTFRFSGQFRLTEGLSCRLFTSRCIILICAKWSFAKFER